MSSSAELRREIGKRKQWLTAAIASADALVPPNISEADTPSLRLAVRNIRAEVDRAREHRNVLKTQARSWDTLIDSLDGEARTKEEKVRVDYIAQKGSFLDLINTSRDDLTRLEEQLRELNTELLRDPRNEPVLSTPSDSLPDEDDTQADENPQPRRARTLPLIKLPPLTLPVFDGNISRWIEFWDAFESAVHSQASIHPVDKFKYLVAHLTGDAAREIQGITASQANYRKAVDKLRRRFGRTEVVRSHLLSKLNGIRPAGEAINQQRRVLEIASDVIAQLDALEADTDHELIISCIEMKFPETTLERVYTVKSKTASWTTAKLLEELDDVISQRELIASLKAFSTSNHEKERERTPSNRNQASQARRNDPSSAMNPPNARRNRSCNYCQGAHPPANCEKYSNSAARKARATELKLCYNCLRDHGQTPCPSQVNCFNCNRRHHTSLCQPQQKTNNGQKPAYRAPVTGSNATPLNRVRVSDPAEPITSNFLTLHALSVTRPPTPWKPMLPCTRMAVSNPNTHTVSTPLCILDSGSTLNYITKALAEELGLIASHSNVKVHLTTIHPGGTPLTTSVYTATVHPALDLPQCLEFFEMPDFLPDQTVGIVKAPQWLPRQHRTRSQFELITGPAGVILGTLQSLRLFRGSNLVTLVDGSVIAETHAGPIPLHLTPPGSSNDTLQLVTPNFLMTMPPKPDQENLSHLWEDNCDFNIQELDSPDDDAEAKLQFEASIRRLADGRYAVGFPRRSDAPNIGTNLGRAFGRLRSEIRRLAVDESRLTRYHDTICEQLSSGIIEEVEPIYGEDVTLNSEGLPVTYIPHASVPPPQKFRVVYDASCVERRSGVSLNDTLFRGAVLLPSLVGILLRFRLYKLPLIGDVEKAFLQVALHPADRDSTRFLWLRDPLVAPTHRNVVHYRFTRVPFGFKPSPYLLAATIIHHLQAHDTPLSKTILRDLYVDNLVIDGSSPNEAIPLVQTVRELFSRAKMNVRDWVSSCLPVRAQLEKAGFPQPESVKILGMRWQLNSDQLELARPPVPNSTATTRRQMLSQQASLYDPLGYLTPLTVRARLLLHEITQSNADWDAQVDPAIQQRWDTLDQERMNHHLSIPRHISTTKPTLHIFADATPSAYGAVAYLTDSLTSQSMILCARTKLRPARRNLSIPIMELLALHLATKLYTDLIEHLHPLYRLTATQAHLWSDSKCALAWVNKDPSQFKEVFIRNRVRDIRGTPELPPFHYVPTDQNPADLAVRGSPADRLQVNNLWWSGPEWLSLPSQWPTSSEEPPEAVESVMLLAQPRPDVKAPLFDTIRFSSWTRLLGTVITVLQFIQLCRKKKASRPSLYNDAFLLLIRQAQKEWLDEKEPTDKELDGLNLSHEDNVLYYQSRIRDSVDDPLNRHPLLLPRDSDLCRLIILDMHHRLMHAGVSQTLATLRRTVWIPQGRITVKKVLKRHCATCQRYDAPPFRLPPFPELPSSRTEVNTPFKYTGLDYAGPVLLKVQSKPAKHWVALFTCLTTRAIHLELITDLTSHSFLLAFRRFTARNGTPSYVLSDNATTFRAAHSLLQATAGFQALHWKFITPLAPWQGGVYEKLIDLVKQRLKRTVGRRLLTVNEYSTLLVEAESVVNSRPLTTVAQDTLEALTPAHFLRPQLVMDGHTLVQETHPDDLEIDQEWTPRETGATKLRANWASTCKTLKKFWKSWSTGYISTLMERRKHIHTQPRLLSHLTPHVGQVVLLADKALPRAEWQLARIAELIPLDKPRDAVITLKDGSTRKRPISMLHPTEVADEPTEEPNSTPSPRKKAKYSPRVTSPASLALGLCAVALLLPTASADEPCTADDCAVWRPSCCTTSQHIGSAVIIMFIVGILYCLMPLAWPLIRQAGAATRALGRLYSQRGAQQVRQAFRRNRRVNRFTALMPIVALVTLNRASACSLVSTLSASQQDCIYSKSLDEVTCSTHQSTLLTLAASKTTSCLVLNAPGHAGATIGSLQITTQRLTLHCQRKIQFYTRDHEIVTESRHRCKAASDSQCHSDFCSQVKAQTNLTDLSALANAAPGYSACAASCQCIGCSWCFLCEPSCLFYRHYAQPTSRYIYRVTSCPAWTLSADLVVVVHSGAAYNSTHHITLTPNQPTTLDLIPANKTQPHGSVSLQLSSATQLALPMLGDSFLENLNTGEIGRVWTSPPGHPVAGTIGQLQCPTLKSAQKFKCKYPHDACSCVNSHYQASCTCFQVSPEEMITHPEHQLPLTTPFGRLHVRNGSLLAEITQHGALNLMVTLKNFTGTPARQKPLCRVSLGSLGGCHSCSTGALLAINCQTDKGSTTGTFQCGTQTLTVACREQPLTQSLRLHFEAEDVDLICKLQCPDNSVDLRVHGRLASIKGPGGSKIVQKITQANLTDASWWASVTFSVGDTLEKASKALSPLITAIKSTATLIATLYTSPWIAIIILILFIVLCYILPLFLRPPVPLRLRL